MSTTIDRWREAAALMQLEDQPVLQAAGRFLADVAGDAGRRERHQTPAGRLELLATGPRVHAADIADAYLSTRAAERSA